MSLERQMHDKTAPIQPNGVVLSPDGSTAYITDTGLFRPGVRTSPHTIYAFDVVRTECAPCPALAPTAAVLHLPHRVSAELTGNADHIGTFPQPDS